MTEPDKGLLVASGSLPTALALESVQKRASPKSNARAIDRARCKAGTPGHTQAQTVPDKSELRV